MLKEIGSLLPENAGMRVLASDMFIACHIATHQQTPKLTLTAPVCNKNTHKSSSRRIIGQNVSKQRE